jgi:protein involved in sex pheromone biosynthesis
MKKILTFALLAGIVIFSACGNNKDDKDAEKKKQDSIEQAKADSIAEAEAKEKAKQDSIDAAEEAAQNYQGNNNNNNNVDPIDKPVEDMTNEEQVEVIKNTRG